MALHADLEDVARAPFLIDLGLADELEARLLDEVGTDVGVLLNAVVPGEKCLVHPARDRQTDFAVSLARRRLFEFRDAGFEIDAAVTQLSRERPGRQREREAHQQRSGS